MISLRIVNNKRVIDKDTTYKDILCGWICRNGLCNHMSKSKTSKSEESCIDCFVYTVGGLYSEDEAIDKLNELLDKQDS